MLGEASQPAEEHRQAGINVSEPGPVERGQGAAGDGDGHYEVGAGRGASRLADEHGPSWHQRYWNQGPVGKEAEEAAGAGDGDYQWVLGEENPDSLTEHCQPGIYIPEPELWMEGRYEERLLVLVMGITTVVA